MPKIEEWISKKLKSIEPQTFFNFSQRYFSESKLPESSFSFYEVPLSSGSGFAFLATPQNEENAQNSLVIMLHGLGDDCTYPLLHWVQALNSNGFTVLSINWDGHGKGSPTTLDFQQASRSISLLLFRLFGDDSDSSNAKHHSEDFKIQSCFLMGNSVGASLALIAASREDVSRNIDGIVAISPVLCKNSYLKASREIRNYLSPGGWVEDMFNKFTYYGLSGLFPSSVQFNRTSFPLRMKIAIEYIDQARFFMSETFEKRRILQNIRKPVLWMHGMKDQIAPYSQVAPLMMEIPSSLFAYNDEKRGHFRMAFSDLTPKYCSSFLDKLNKIKSTTLLS